MTIPWTTDPGGYFVRQGHIGGALSDLRTIHKASGTADADRVALVNQFANLTESGGIYREEDFAAKVANVFGSETLLTGYYRGGTDIRAALQTLAQNVTKRMVRRDNPQIFGDENNPDALELASKELYRQMVAASQTVKAHTVSAASVADLGGFTPTGNGAIAVSVKRGDGLSSEALWAETIKGQCWEDGYSGKVISGSEIFRFTGYPFIPLSHPEYGSAANPNYFGSGCDIFIRAIDATRYIPLGGNCVRNGAFNDWLAGANSAPDRWSLTGTGGTDWRRSSTAYSGSYSLEFIGGTGVSPILHTIFDDEDFTPYKLLGVTQYCACFALKADVVPASGTFVAELTDSGGTVIADDAGTNNTSTITLSSGVTTSFVLQKFYFRTKKTISSGTRLRLKVGTAIPGGTSIFLGHVAVAPMIPLYPGGPEVLAFSGSTPWVGAANRPRDAYTFAMSNDYGGASHRLASFQTLLADTHGFMKMGVQLPTAGSPTIDNALITV